MLKVKEKINNSEDEGYLVIEAGKSEKHYWSGYILSIALTFLIAIWGFWYFRKTEKTFADRI